MEKILDIYMGRKDTKSGLSERNKKKSIVLISVMAVIAMTILSSGCIHLTENIRVSSNGDISYMKMSMTMSPLIYNMMIESVQEEGYSGLQEYVKSTNPAATYNEEWGDDEVTITIELKEGKWVPLGNSKIEITSDASTITYRDNTYMNQEELDQSSYDTGMYSGIYDAVLKSVRIDIYLEMPGEIIDTNAQYVDEKRAEWHLDGTTMKNTEIYAKSKKGFVLAPGLIVIGGGILFSIVLVGLILRKRSRNRMRYY